MNSVHTLQSALALSLLHSLWQAGVLALLAGSVLALLERRSAAIRHAVGMVFLLAMALAPLATFAWLIGRPDAAVAAVAGGWSASAPTGVLDVALSTPVSAPSWLPWLWCAGVVVMLARLIGGWWIVRTLDHQAFEPLPAHWRLRAENLRRALGIRREVTIRLLQGVGLPCTARAWRPVVWLPVSMLTRLDPDQIEALIAHELAHIRRLDWIWNGLQCAVEALLFFHPGMWWLSRRIRQERENACDDLAVAVCGDAIVLAEALATLERHRIPAHALALAANGGALMHRVKRLLSTDQPTRLRWAVPVGVLGVVCSGALLAAQLQSAKPAQPAAPAQPAQAFPSANNHSFKVTESTFPGGERVYRSTTNGAGKLTETYTVNGEARPIDAVARKWITRTQVLANAPLPPLPGLPPLPPLPPLPEEVPPAPPAPLTAPTPPPPPAPPSLTSTAAYRAAVKIAQQDPGVIALVGSPVRAGAVSGNSHLSAAGADLVFTVSGPKGRAHVSTRAELKADVWDIEILEIWGR